MTVRYLHVGFLIVYGLTAGCVHQASVHDFGLPSAPQTKSPDAAVREIFQNQTKGAFDPLSDDERVQQLRKRLQLNSNDAGAHVELASVYEGYRLYDNALDEYTRGEQLSRAAANRLLIEKAVFGIARCEQAVGRSWRAIPVLEQFLKEVPSAAGWNNLGLLYNASGNLAEGEAVFREAVAENSASDQFHNNLGYNLLLQNKIDAAEGEFQRALELNPKSVTAHNNFGTALAHRGELRRALEEFQFLTDEATAYNNLAVVLIELGKYEESREQLVKALALRRYFGPALSNFKLVQDRIREREELAKVGRRAQKNLHVASAEQEASQKNEQGEK